MVYVRCVLTSGYLRFDWNRQSSLKVCYCVASVQLFRITEKIEEQNIYVRLIRSINARFVFSLFCRVQDIYSK
jgi:hypothetical protein